MSMIRVTVTLPADLLEDIDRQEKNRSRFFLEAARHELERRRMEQFRLSLDNPHPETSELELLGLQQLAEELPEEEDDLIIPGVGQAVRWIPGEGWMAGP